MVKFFSTRYTYDHHWSTVTLAWFMRYPNPYAAHVVAADVIDRYVDGAGRLHTTRLLLKKGKLPDWGAKFLNFSHSYILEHSVVDPGTKTMHTRTRNLDHTKVMQVEETQVYTENSNNTTRCLVEARFLSPFGWGVARPIERFGKSKFIENLQKKRNEIYPGPATGEWMSIACSAEWCTSKMSLVCCFLEFSVKVMSVASTSRNMFPPRLIRAFYPSSARTLSKFPKAPTINLDPPKDSHSLPQEHPPFPTSTSSPPFDRNQPRDEKSLSSPRSSRRPIVPPVKGKRKNKHTEGLEDEIVQPVSRENEDTETMRARLLHQSRKRGTLELELLLSTFASKYLKEFTRKELQEYDKILEYPEPVLYDLATSKKELEEKSKVLEKLIMHAKNEGREMRRMPDIH